jgi:hypothetical protein
MPRRRAVTAVGLAVLSTGAAGCSASAAPPHHHAASHASTTQLSSADLRALASRYLVIATPANHRLDVEVDGYLDAEHTSLAMARADLRAEIVTERRFDAQLLRIHFPPWIATTARALVHANSARIALTERQARATSLAAMRAFDRRHDGANAALETQVRLIRQFLGLPPPETS